MLFPAWASFIIALIIIMALSRKELAFSLSLGALVSALLAEVSIWDSLKGLVIKPLSEEFDPQVLIIATIMFIIPLLGGVMNESNMMKELIDNMGVSKKNGMMLSPALFGLLPVAGGAILSMPMVDQIEPDPKFPKGQKVAINVWYRHVLVLIYPLGSTLLICSQPTGLSLYTEVAILLIPFTVMLIVGYIFLIRPVSKAKSQHARNLNIVFHHLIPLLIAPFFDLIGRTVFGGEYPDLYPLFGLVISLSVAMIFGKKTLRDVVTIAKKMKVWKFPLLILAIFWFQSVFILSSVPIEMSSLSISFPLFMVVGFFLGFATGRVALPCSILIPVYLLQYGTTTMGLIPFAILYFAIFLGYIITPIHPCISYSIKAMDSSYKEAIKYFAKPTLVSALITLIFAFIFVEI